MPPTVSINLCCYNSEKYLRETLESILHQTYKNWELIIINDGSTDSTESIVQEYIDAGYPIIYHYQQNKGLSYSRNKALELSGGDYIALIDHDDLWLPEKLAKQVIAMQRNKDHVLCYAGVIEIDHMGMELRRYNLKNNSGYMFETLLRQFDINVPTALFRKSILQKSGLRFDERVSASEEYCLFMQLAVNHKFLVLPDILAKYRIYDEALTAKSISKWADEREYTLNLICNDNPGIEKKYPVEFKEAYARARYYRVRYYVSIGNKLKAIALLSQNLLTNWRYMILFIILLLPTLFWNFIHKIKTKREI